ncbi:MAG: GNAT family N-acetyltransferase, partial [Candidatus Cloacimonetes bacterium]|nr:GNAT family N-acetyltransferase [Candidatus Cloacimonadota bacterium]
MHSKKLLAVKKEEKIKKIKIVEYEHKYAKAVAEMWKNSKQGWNGETFFTTEQAVISEEENSIHLNAWLALDEGLVVGYCDLYEYYADTGALYIGLLNVQDDHHGQKFGKALLLKAIQQTIELGWERLDLYTWDGNVKAVPLYKKAGFFWEDNDDSTHCFNLIPVVLNNELIKNYFKKIDWYTDNIRKIEVKPDGRKENEFEYLTYEWEKDGTHLLAEFCRRGRGLRRIETDEFSITVTVEDLKLVFSNKYKIKYEFINKTGKPLNIDINGKNEKNIEFDFTQKFSVVDAKAIEAEFYVGKIEKEQNKWKTYPNVISEISVNGKKALFKTGIEPKFPAKLSLVQIDGICYKDVETQIFLDIENCFKEKATFSFDLPKSDKISFQPNRFEIVLNPEEKRSIPIKYL